MRVLICGSREWTYRGPIEVVVGGLATLNGPSEMTVVHGGARGADLLAAEVAADFGIPTVCYPANWDAHGRSAGHIRNQQMLDEGRPELVFAFTEDMSKSRGTRDMVERAKAAGVATYVVRRA